MGNSDEGTELIFDQKDFLERVEGDMDLARQLGEMFLEDAHEKMEILRDSIEKKDMEEVVRAAHSLKGASANMSALRVRRIAADLEETAKKEEKPGVAELFELLENSLSDFESAFKSHILA